MTRPAVRRRMSVAEPGRSHTMWAMSDDEQQAPLRDRLDAEIGRHAHSQAVSVVQHPNYEPYVKLVCAECPAETYVHR